LNSFILYFYFIYFYFILFIFILFLFIFYFFSFFLFFILSRASIKRISSVVFALPVENAEPTQELRGTIVKLLEDIDVDLSNLPTEVTTGETPTTEESAESIRARISRMMQELDVLETKCKKLSSSSSVSSLFTSPGQDHPHALTTKLTTMVTPNPLAPLTSSILNGEEIVTVKAAHHEVSIQSVADDADGEEADVMEWQFPTVSSKPTVSAAVSGAKQVAPLPAPLTPAETEDELKAKMKSIGRRNLMQEESLSSS
jgi:hypothetical protein